MGRLGYGECFYQVDSIGFANLGMIPTLSYYREKQNVFEGLLWGLDRSERSGSALPTEI